MRCEAMDVKPRAHIFQMLPINIVIGCGLWVSMAYGIDGAKDGQNVNKV